MKPKFKPGDRVIDIGNNPRYKGLKGVVLEDSSGEYIDLPHEVLVQYPEGTGWRDDAQYRVNSDDLILDQAYINEQKMKKLLGV